MQTNTGTPIVVGYDGSDSADDALRWGAAEAARLGAPIHIVHVLEWPTVTSMGPGPLPFPDQNARRRAEALVDEAVRAQAARSPNLAVSGHVRVGAAGPQLIAESARARLLVVGHRGWGGFAGLLLGSVGVAVAANARCPVAVVRGDAAGGGRGAPVLVGHDGSEPARRALDVAFQAASVRGVMLQVLRAWYPPAPPWGPPDPTVDPEELAVAEHTAVADAIEPAARRFPDVPVAIDVVVDGPGHALATASALAQLVVVGSRGRGGFAGLLLGSVSQQLLHHAACPVIVVHESQARLAATAA